MNAIQRLRALASASDVEAAKIKLNADISRAMNMVQKSVSNGDGSGKEYQAKLMSLRTQLRDCTMMSQVQKVRDQLNEAQSSRRNTAAEEATDIPKVEDLPKLDNKQLLGVYTKMTAWLRKKKVNMAFCQAVIKECQKRGI